MKKVKEYLRNVMIVEECKHNIKTITSNYPDTSDDGDISKEHLTALVDYMKTIVDCNKKINTPVAEDEECLQTLENLLKAKQSGESDL